ncbi:MAG: YHS domain-containing (seleno)protein [Congregibacter sp.]
MKLFRTLRAVTGLLFLGLSTVAFADVDTQTDENDVILAGHDAVAYFTEGKPVLGSADYTAEYNGAVYRFSSAENRDLFRAEPASYAPQYGGFCAFGLTFGKKFEIDGKAFKVVDGKLYVNKNLEVAKAWNADIPKHIDEAEGFWPKVAQTPAGEL